MLTDTDDDYFFEEDKIPSRSECADTVLIQIDDETESGKKGKNHRSVSSNTEGAEEQASVSGNSSDPIAAIVCMGPYVERRLDYQKAELSRLGMTVTTGTVIITKDESNLIGISIGGGAPLCPCLYIVQIFDGTPAAKDGSLQSGDELLAINSESVKGKTKQEVAKMIQSSEHQVTIHYNKLHVDIEQGKSLDILMKKIKHRCVESMSSNTADTLGLSRAILCNDSLVKRLEELEGTELMYKGLVEHAKRMLKAFFDLLETYKEFGDVFAAISVKEPQQRASEAFRQFAELHRHMEKDGLDMLKAVKPVLNDLGTYLNKAIPDTKLTVKRYADSKFTYLSYCLKVKEMDDEEHSAASMQEPLYRVETGNYEYRLILRCRQAARTKFAQLRNDVLEKMELLECKHATDLTNQLRKLIDSLAKVNRTAVERIEAMPNLFPIEVDFKESDFEYKSKILNPQEEDDEVEELACGLEAVELPAEITTFPTDSSCSGSSSFMYDMPGTSSQSALIEPTDEISEINLSQPVNNDDLLRELGLYGIDLNIDKPSVSEVDLLLQ